MIENLNLATNKTFLPGVELPDSETYYLSPEEYNTLVLKVKELIDAHNSLSVNVTSNISILSIVFRRTNDSVIGTPVGGDFSSPVPTSFPTWTDGIPDGEETLWASSRIFTSDGEAPQQNSWQTPTKMTDTSYFDVEFSSLEVPGNPTDNPSNWSNNGNSSTIWMATAVLRNGQRPTASDWTIVRIKGEAGADGKDQEFIYITKATTDPPYDISLLPAIQTPEYLPDPPETYGQWTDDPRGVTASKQFEWVSKRTRNNGVWSKFSKPALWARFAIDGDGQSSFKSFVFKRQVDAPSRPESGNGSFDNPLPDPVDGWTDYIPSGTNPLWVSTRMFSKDGALPQEPNWTDPVIMADSSDLDVSFSKHADPGNPTDNPLLWSEIADEETIWMAMRHLTAGSWTNWQIIKIKGEGGTGLSTGSVYLYKRAASIPSEPSGNLTYNFATNELTGDLEGWNQLVPENNGNPIWITFATISSLEFTDIITPSEWSTPVILAQDGAKSAVIYLYQRSAESPIPATPSTTCEYFFVTQVLTGTLGNWSLTIPTTNGDPLWMIAATVYSSTESDIIEVDDWTDPITLVRDGQDGPGYESIFKLTEDGIAPATPATFQQDDFIPVGWSDNPLSVTSQYRFCWVSKRSKRNNTWGNFSDPKIFSNYSRDGVAGPASGMVYYQLDSSSAPSSPSAISYNFSTGTFTGLTNNWDVGAPTYAAGNQKSYWYSSYVALDSDGDGVGTVTFGPVTKAISFSGLVSFNSGGTSITDGEGNELSFGVDGQTTIIGDNIRTGKIGGTTYGGMETGGTGYTNSGMIIDLDNQSIHAPKFQILPTGEIKMKGEHDISDAVLVGCALKSTNYVAGTGGFSSAGTYINLLDGSFMTKNFKIDSNGNAVFKGDIEASTLYGNVSLDSGGMIYCEPFNPDIFKYTFEIGKFGAFWIGTAYTDIVTVTVGNIRIGSGLLKLENWSQVKFTDYYIDNSGVTGNFTITGNVTAAAFYQSSDINKKHNIQDIDYENIFNVSRIGLKQFVFNEDTKNLQKYGVIAQEVETYFPNLVNTNDKGEKTVDYTSFLILRVKSLEQRINELERMIMICQ